MSYDPKCHEVAEYFLADDTPQPIVAKLAQRIQDAIEDELTDPDFEPYKEESAEQRKLLNKMLTAPPPEHRAVRVLAIPGMATPELPAPDGPYVLLVPLEAEVIATTRPMDLTQGTKGMISRSPYMTQTGWNVQFDHKGVGFNLPADTLRLLRPIIERMPPEKWNWLYGAKVARERKLSKQEGEGDL